MRERRTAADWAERCADLKPAGRGKWSGPCPLCGGVDRFHVESRADGGAIIGCRGCIDGLPQVSRRARFGEIVRAVWAGSGDSRTSERSTRRPSFSKAAREATRPEQMAAAQLWASAIPDPGPVRRYLAARGIWPSCEPLPGTVRWIPADELIAARAFGGLPNRSSMAGAMVCAFRRPGADPASAPVAVNVEALTNDGQHTRPRFRKDRGSKTGAAFIVQASGMDGAGPIHVAEGEADALAIAWWRRVEAWGAAGSSGVLPKLALPLLLTGREIIIEADGDTAGRAAAGKLEAVLKACGAAVRVIRWPSGMDPADGLTADWRAIRDERAAILEYEHNVRRADAEQAAVDAAWAEFSTQPRTSPPCTLQQREQGL